MVFLVVTVVMFLFRIMLPFLPLSVLFVFLCTFYFWLISVCVHVRLFNKVVAAFSFMRKVERKRLKGGGLNREL